MEKFSDLRNASTQDFEWLQHKIDSLPLLKPYLFDDVLLYPGCSPDSTTVGFYRSEQGYALFFNERISYTGDNLILKRLFSDGLIVADTMDHLHAFCEQLPDESTNQPPETQPVVTVEDDITDFDASDTIKRLMNQAIFEKFYIISNDEVELDIEFSFRPPFDKLLEPIKDDIAQINKNKSSNRIGNALTIAKGHIQEFLECGLSDVDNPSNMSTYSNDGYFFRHKSLSKVLLVDQRGIEPLSKSQFNVLLLS